MTLAFGLLLPSCSTNKKGTSCEVPFLLVGAGGFGPPKSVTTDLQSAPFGRSGTLPYSFVSALLHQRMIL